MKSLTFIKKYLYGNQENGGYFKYFVEKSQIDENELFEKYDLCCPIYRNQTLILGGLKNSGGLNDLAYQLFDTMVFSDDCIIVFDDEEFTDLKYDIICNLIKTDLIEKGMDEKSFNY